MSFSQKQIDLARVLKQLGIPWEPAVGHYVYDEDNVVTSSSPFQTGVYFILNFDHFMRIVGGVQRFKECMVWLPTWEDAREILRSFGVSDVNVQHELVRNHAISNAAETVTLYGLIREQLERRADAGPEGEQAPTLSDS